MKGFEPLFGMLTDRIEALLADKGLDADVIREELAKADVGAVIPAKSNRRIPIPHAREKYRSRNLVEELFQQAEELAPCHHSLQKNGRILPRLRRTRISDAVAALWPQGLDAEPRRR